MGLVPSVRLRPLAAVLVAAIVAAGAIVGVRLVAGDPSAPPPPLHAPTPAPPPAADLPSALQERSKPGQPPPLTVAGMQVPVPPGSEYGGGPGTLFQSIRRGNSIIWFDGDGMLKAQIAPEDQPDFQPTLDAFHALEANRAPRPPVFVAGVQLPLPPGSGYYAEPVAGDLYVGRPQAIYNGRSRIDFDDMGLLTAEIAQVDQGDFQPTLDVLRALVERSRAPRPPVHVGNTPGGVLVPLPPGAWTTIAPDQSAPGPAGLTGGIHRGNSVIWFDNAGTPKAQIAPEDQSDFQATLDALSGLPGSPR